VTRKRRQIARHLGMALGSDLASSLERGFLSPNLLLIDRRRDDRRRPSILQPADAVEGRRKRRGAGDNGMTQRQAEIARLQVHCAASPFFSSRVAASSCQNG